MAAANHTLFPGLVQRLRRKGEGQLDLLLSRILDDPHTRAVLDLDLEIAGEPGACPAANQGDRQNQ